MFTGIVRERGRVVSAERNGGGVRLRITATETAGAALGDSISVSGCCLTVTAAGDGALEFDAVPETIARTTLGSLEPGVEVNLEPALRAGEPLGGHFVQGHVDCVGTVRSMERQGENRYLSLSLPTGRELAAPRGSIAVDGVSLTILDADPAGVRLSIVPHTWAATAFPDLSPGGGVNVEYDVIARYLKHLAEGQPVADFGARTG